MPEEQILPAQAGERRPREILELAKNDQLSEGMQARMKKGSKMPGWVRRDGFDWYATIQPSES